jgi:hypothetical protein
MHTGIMHDRYQLTERYFAVDKQRHCLPRGRFAMSITLYCLLHEVRHDAYAYLGQRDDRLLLLPEKRKVGSSTLPLTTSFGLVSSALTSANAEWSLSRLSPSNDHECPCVTVVGHSLSHADRTPCLRALGSPPLRPELAVALVLTRRPSVFQAGRIPGTATSLRRWGSRPGRGVASKRST